ncbi:hypothetical protein [Acetobacter sp.]|jgi:hypothetical protein|uniref:hypothetical protein n=1 Tax=Acetobacter sp. TaxID=440 RepID=UPI0025BB0D28|nr:hypothetical protein [Acetobacter sp.]MCH4089755.1 hypothetical protein [Acetobacter sp.]MCI1298451.1 hypothetical protein [Acetobacter sp.]MCI1316406.1 hypothetical protein [Acetobacter sp.]
MRTTHITERLSLRKKWNRDYHPGWSLLIAVVAGLCSGLGSGYMFFRLDQARSAQIIAGKNARIAILTAQKQAVEARAKAEQIKANVVWRDISDEARLCLQNDFVNLGNDFEIITLAGDAEATFMADQTQAVLEEIDRKIQRSQIFSARGIGEYYVYDKNPRTASGVAAALSRCGFPARTMSAPITAAGIAGPLPAGFDTSNAVQLFINTRKKPHFSFD